jgi:hypothetical protein
LIPALDGWVLCVDEEGEDCTISVKLPDWVDKDKVKRIYIALYIAARTTMDYRVAAALHIYSARNKVAVHPNIAIKALTGSKIYSKISRSMEDEDYAWQAVLYRGILYAQSILDLERPVLVKVDPPRDKRERERLRIEEDKDLTNHPAILKRLDAFKKGFEEKVRWILMRYSDTEEDPICVSEATLQIDFY